MLRTRLRCKRFIFSFLLLVILVIFIIIIVNNNIRRVFYDYQVHFHGLPGHYLSTRFANENHCNYRFGLPDELLYEESDLHYPFEQRDKSPYRVLQNVIEAKWDKSIPQVTYVTHMSADFVNYLSEIVRFWEGPISVAAFVPDFDADLTIRQLYQLCSCTPEMRRVSVHFIFPLSAPPYLQNVHDPLTCTLPDSATLPTYRKTNQLMYPINVGRNTARSLAPTDYVMVSDIQLVPSEALASQFGRMVRQKWRLAAGRVYVVPVFEVEAFDVMPRRKEELLMMVRKERAVYFHRYVCAHCQKFPGMKTWLETKPNRVKPFVSVKREHPFHRWEPIYIGGKSEPMYAEALSWEGLQDKMTQMLEMCLIGYQFVILDGAFLVHWPGINREKHKFNLRDYFRAPFQKNNSMHYSEIIKKLRDKYKNINANCKL